jgi:hypothetical protein
VKSQDGNKYTGRFRGIISVNGKDAPLTFSGKLLFEPTIPPLDGTTKVTITFTATPEKRDGSTTKKVTATLKASPPPGEAIQWVLRP